MVNRQPKLEGDLDKEITNLKEKIKEVHILQNKLYNFEQTKPSRTASNNDQRIKWFEQYDQLEKK